MDAYTAQHLEKWLAHVARDEEKDTLRDSILKLVADHPDLLERGYSWPEMRRMTEV